MQFVYSFTYYYESEIRDGALSASSKEDAIVKLNRIGLKPLKVTFNLMLTIKLISSSEYDYKDLIRLYKTIGNRIAMGKGMIDGLESAGEFIFDKRLKFATLSMASELKMGNKIYDAMLKSGFNKIDAMVIKASEMSGNQAESFVRLAKEIARKNEISSSIKKIFVMPAITMFLIYVGCFAAPYFFGINTEKQLKGLNVKLDDFDTYFKIAHFSHDNTIFYLMIAIAPLVGLFLLFKYGIIQQWLDKWKLWKSISVKSDLSNMWTAFAQLWDAGVTPEECAKLVIDSSERKDTKEAFGKLKKGLSSGKNISDATSKSGFIPVVTKGIRAADEGAALSFPEGVLSMAEELSADVIAMVEILKAWFMVSSTIAGGLGILFFVYIALGPIYITVLKSF